MWKRTASVLVMLGFCIVCQARDWDSVRRMVREEFPDVPQISTEELAGMIAGPPEGRPLLFDVRTTEEYAVSHLSGAIRAGSAKEILKRLERMEMAGPIVLYCSVGYRSSEAAEILRKRGYSNVSNLEGSLFRWANEGRPMVREGEPVKVAHPFNDDWGTLLDRHLWSKGPR